MAKETIKKEAETKKKAPRFNNNAHLHGYVNGVRMNDMENGRTAINLDVVTLETYKTQDGSFKNNRTYHDVVLFTEDKDIIAKFGAIAADVQANRENKDVKDFKPTVHTISCDGIVVNRENTIRGTEEKYNSPQILLRDGSFKLDVKQEDKEVRNRVELVGNIASVKVYEDKGFAVATVINHYRPEGSEKEFSTSLQVRADADRKFSKPMYEALKDGKLEVGDFIRVGGQMHNNNYEVEAGKRFGMALDVTTHEVLKKKADKAVKVETAKAKTETKKAAPKKATSNRKKNGMKV